MSQALIHQPTHLHVTSRLGRAVTFIDGPTVVQVLLDIRPAVDRPNAPTLELRLVIDRSSSMKGEKLKAVKEALLAVVDDLHSEDTLSIVSFNEISRVDLKPKQMSRRGKASAIKAINSLEAYGNTSISGAVARAIGKTDPKRETRVVLFTDGESTTDPHQDHTNLVAHADHARNQKLP